MKKNRIETIMILSTLIFLLIGCKTTKEDINNITLLDDNETVKYDNEGQYDLSQYILPSQNQRNIYQVSKYEYNIESKTSSQNPLVVINNEYVDYIIEDGITKIGYNTEYQVNDIAIYRKEFVDDRYDKRYYARYLDIGEYYYIFENIDIDSTYTQSGLNKCLFKEHMDSTLVMNKKYTDILHLSCQGKFKEEVIGEFFEIKEFIVDYYFAKGIGQVQLTSIKCTDSKFNQTAYHSCIETDRKLKENSPL
jgi:hypothetical protein